MHSHANTFAGSSAPLQARAQLLMTERMVNVLAAIPGVQVEVRVAGNRADADYWLTPMRLRHPLLTWAMQVSLTAWPT